MMVKVIGLALAALTASLVIKNIHPNLTQLLVISVSVGIFIICLDRAKESIGYFYDLCNSNRYGEYFKVMLKGLGVGYLSSIGSDICRACGEGVLAGRIELAAKIEILVIAFPLVKSLIELSESILIS
ncbi:MAG: hypothetical protein IKU19_07125 [Clostridia bacterium]|nr:hypothetical protein [Clostridia bacterium]